MDEPGEDICTTCHHPDHSDEEEGCPVRLAVYLGADGWAEGGPCGCRYARDLTGAHPTAIIVDDPWTLAAAVELEPPF